ncbi:hypothetical protein ANN_26150 [Periplaneta americana]|uniref:Uncharacterized protein n=1 Tax=Periplaneta americana TaxID=6978 RepID=A0ABQ8S545_PERAM|nr:hypothetical protein ANN_26150 [Periplaneta americana]
MYGSGSGSPEVKPHQLLLQHQAHGALLADELGPPTDHYGSLGPAPPQSPLLPSTSLLNRHISKYSFFTKQVVEIERPHQVQRKPNCTKRVITTVPEANDAQVLKAIDPPSLEEVEDLRLKRAAENEPVEGPAQIFQCELEDVPSGMLPFLPLRESLKRNMNKRRQRKLPSHPKSLSDLHALPQEFRITTSGEQFLMFDSFDDHDNDDEDDFYRIIILTSKSHLRKLSCSAT